MQAERTRWTDERIEDLASCLKSVRDEMKEGFAKVDARFDRLEGRMWWMTATVLAAIAAGNFTG